MQLHLINQLNYYLFYSLNLLIGLNSICIPELNPEQYYKILVYQLFLFLQIPLKIFAAIETAALLNCDINPISFALWEIISQSINAEVQTHGLFARQLNQ